MAAEHAQAAIKHPPREMEEDNLSIVYPDSDDEPMAENDFQYIAMTDTISALRNRYIDRPDIYVAGDMLMYYRMNDNTTQIAPDVFAVFDAAGDHPQRSWLVWREGKAPNFVMEVASPSSWRQDAIEKRDIYADMKATEYWRFDPLEEYFTPPLVGERLVNGEYLPIPMTTDDHGTLRGHSAILGLDICVKESLALRLYDPVSREWLLTPQESEAARLEEIAARRTAETELARLRAQLSALQSDSR